MGLPVSWSCLASLKGRKCKKGQGQSVEVSIQTGSKGKPVQAGGAGRAGFMLMNWEAVQVAEFKKGGTQCAKGKTRQVRGGG